MFWGPDNPSWSGLGVDTVYRAPILTMIQSLGKGSPSEEISAMAQKTIGIDAAMCASFPLCQFEDLGKSMALLPHVRRYPPDSS